METLSVLLALCEGNPPLIKDFPSHRAGNTELLRFIVVNLNNLFDKQLSFQWSKMH